MMDREQIETLKKMADADDRCAKQCGECANEFAQLGNPRAAETWGRKADEARVRAATLRAAIALAEERAALEGWEPVTYLRSSIIVTRQGDGQWYVEDETEFRYLSYGGVWSGFESREVFADESQAIAAANKAIGGGK
jgi:hypothetical protein